MAKVKRHDCMKVGACWRCCYFLYNKEKSLLGNSITRFETLFLWLQCFLLFIISIIYLEIRHWEKNVRT